MSLNIQTVVMPGVFACGDKVSPRVHVPIRVLIAIGVTKFGDAQLQLTRVTPAELLINPTLSSLLIRQMSSLSHLSADR